MSPSPSVSFEGPEKRLYVSFLPSTLPASSLRAMKAERIDAILRAASCTLLSSRRDSTLDAYLLSESSLFVSDRSIMIKTCGSTTLLRALPQLLQIVDELGLVAAFVQYSHVRFSFPLLQPFPHNTFENEVSFLNSVLSTRHKPLQLGASDWNVYIAPLIASPPPLPPTLEIFMFDLDPTAMLHYLHNGDSTRAGSHFAIEYTTVRSRISSLLSPSATIDAHNFLPCGYSLNAIDDDGTYATIHISPEPQASYVSFESTTDHANLADTVAAVVSIFQPARFTVSFIGPSNCAAVEANLADPIQSALIETFLDGAFAVTMESVPTLEAPNIWATSVSFELKGLLGKNMEKRRIMSTGNVKVHPILQSVTNKMPVQIVAGTSVAEKARKFVKVRDKIERPLFLVDLDWLMRRSWYLKAALPPRFAPRYAVRCNRDQAVLTVLNKLGWMFEAISMKEVTMLQKAGVVKENIVFVSPLVSIDVVQRINEIGILSLFSKPSDLIMNAIQSSDVELEIRVPESSVEETVDLCNVMLRSGGRIASFAVDCDPGIRLLDGDLGMIAVEQSLKTIDIVRQRLMMDAINVSIGELSIYSQEDELLRLCNKLDICNNAIRVFVDVGRWVVGPSTELALNVVSRRVRLMGNDNGNVENEVHYYYLNDGVYGAFSSVGMYRSMRTEKSCKNAPEVIRRSRGIGSDEDAGEMKLFKSILFGPTCDALDKIWTGMLQNLEIGDVLLFHEMGAYALSAVSTFNGFGNDFDIVYVAGEGGKGVVKNMSFTSDFD